MGLHKLTAGDGYTYLLRQVAVADGTDLGRASLSDYYSSKGETPGRWVGSGLTALGRPVSRDPDDPLVEQLWGVPDGSEVTEEQMKALFGEGLHPNATKITEHLTGIGLWVDGAHAAAKLGRPFRLGANENDFTRRLRGAYGQYNVRHRSRHERAPGTRSPRRDPHHRRPRRCSPNATAARTSTSGN